MKYISNRVMVLGHSERALGVRRVFVYTNHAYSGSNSN